MSGTLSAAEPRGFVCVIKRSNSVCMGLDLEQQGSAFLSGREGWGCSYRALSAQQANQAATGDGGRGGGHPANNEKSGFWSSGDDFYNSYELLTFEQKS